MEVIKRDGKKVTYDGSRIILAIQKAMSDLGEIDQEISEKIEEDIVAKMLAFDSAWSVEEISDEVENQLMEHKLFAVAKAYIYYRSRQKDERKHAKEYKYLSNEFLSTYKHKKPPMTELGNLVFYRTYSRYIKELNRREYWNETVARVVDYNIGLAPWESRDKAVREAELMFDNVFNLRQFPSGRALWSGGTKTSYTNPISQFNCAFSVFDNFDIVKDITYLLMLGVGFGFSVEKQYVDDLPLVRGNLNVMHQVFSPVKKKARKETTEYNITGNVIEIIVGDSKIGWASAIDILTKCFYSVEFREVEHVWVNYNNVRPFGEPLVTFGGTASGHEALQVILEKLSSVMSKDNDGYKKLEPVDAMDIATIIAEGIVVGGVRRSAEMCLSSDKDEAMMNAKMDLYVQGDDGVWNVNDKILHRMMSNNSTAYWEKPTLEELMERFEIIKHSAENNFFNMEAAKKRKSNVKGTNPCGEILLDSNSFCNLTTINCMAFVEDGVLNRDTLLLAQSLSARISYRVTIPTLELPKWDNTQKRDRLLGLSLTGYQDMVNATNMSIEEQKQLLNDLRDTGRNSADNYAISLGMSLPELTSTVKPEGTLSQLPTVSSGVHFSHSPFYVRRVRVNASDPLVSVCTELGYPIYPEVGQDAETCRTKVIEFPVEAPSGRTKYDVSAIEQLEIYKMFMEEYVEHNASNTISVRPDEWEGVVQWVYENWDTIIGVTFISLDDSFYKLLPYEAITEEEYNERKDNMKEFNPDLLLKYEVKLFDEDLLDDDCSTGVCGVR